MNATEQRQRHTAITELREEVGTVVDALLKSVGQQLTAERQEWTKALDAEHRQIMELTIRLDHLRAVGDDRWASTADTQRILFAKRDVVFHRNLLGRLWWLVTGR